MGEARISPQCGQISSLSRRGRPHFGQVFIIPFYQELRNGAIAILVCELFNALEQGKFSFTFDVMRKLTHFPI